MIFQLEVYTETNCPSSVNENKYIFISDNILYNSMYYLKASYSIQRQKRKEKKKETKVNRVS
jgi:hypothetical protein